MCDGSPVSSDGQQTRADKPGDDEPWRCRHIRLSNPAGPGAPEVPRLLRAVADLLERIGDDIDVLDLTLRQDDHRDGVWSSMNIYYRRPSPTRRSTQ